MRHPRCRAASLSDYAHLSGVHCIRWIQWPLSLPPLSRHHYTQRVPSRSKHLSSHALNWAEVAESVRVGICRCVHTFQAFALIPSHCPGCQGLNDRESDLLICPSQRLQPLRLWRLRSRTSSCVPICTSLCTPLPSGTSAARYIFVGRGLLRDEPFHVPLHRRIR